MNSNRLGAHFRQQIVFSSTYVIVSSFVFFSTFSCIHNKSLNLKHFLYHENRICVNGPQFFYSSSLLISIYLKIEHTAVLLWFNVYSWLRCKNMGTWVTWAPQKRIDINRSQQNNKLCNVACAGKRRIIFFE